MATGNFKLQDGFPLYAMETDLYEWYELQEIVETIESIIDEKENHLELYRIKVIDGYYTGLQLFVETDQNAMDSLYYYNSEEEAEQAEKEDYNNALQVLQRIAEKCGFDEYRVAARFSNGETIYSKVKGEGAC